VPRLDQGGRLSWEKQLNNNIYIKVGQPLLKRNASINTRLMKAFWDYVLVEFSDFIHYGSALLSRLFQGRKPLWIFVEFDENLAQLVEASWRRSKCASLEKLKICWAFKIDLSLHSFTSLLRILLKIFVEFEDNFHNRFCWRRHTDWSAILWTLLMNTLNIHSNILWVSISRADPISTAANSFSALA